MIVVIIIEIKQQRIGECPYSRYTVETIAIELSKDEKRSFIIIFFLTFYQLILNKYTMIKSTKKMHVPTFADC